MSTMSYVSGVADRPLLGETIGRHFDRTVERWGDRPGLIVRQQGVRLTWRALQALQFLLQDLMTRMQTPIITLEACLVGRLKMQKVTCVNTTTIFFKF